MKRITLALLFFWPLSAAAEEGMWTLDHFPKEAVQQLYGAQVTDEWLDKVRLSTTRLGGCTGSFASPNGLILTNNHCVWGCVRNLSTDERNLSEEGFYAADPSQELRCQGQRISVLMGTEEITGQVAGATAGKNEVEANEARDATLSRLELACEEASGGELSCQSGSLYNGGQYFLYKYKHYTDVRLVFAPEMPIAAFGGDPDNFNFPRYCLDMSFLRVYEDGEPANTPHYLSWRTQGPREGEPVFVVGHPGSTQRLLTVAGLKRLRETLPENLLLSSELRGRMIEWGKTSKEASRVVQQRLLGLENGLKVGRNRLVALLDDSLLERKLAEEHELRAAVAADSKLEAAYGSSWADNEAAIAAFRGFSDSYLFVEGGQAFRSRLFGYARTLARGASEREKPNEERLREFRETALPGIERQLLAPIPTQMEYEKLTLTFSLEKMLERLGPDHAAVKNVLGKESPGSLAEKLLDGTRLADAGYRRELWQGGRKAIEAADDSMVRLALAVDADARALRKRYQDEVQAPQRLAAEKIARARFAVYGTDVYPDATFTLRVSYGAVKGWLEKGKPVGPFTTLQVLPSRVTGKEPFRLPESWVEAWDKLDPATPFNFVANTDIIGGNSGSPMVDQAGDLVGLIFDGNIHSIPGAYWFDGSKNRSIAVHPAIMVEALEKVYNARGLLKELGIER